MKIYVLTKKTLIIAALLLLSAAFILPTGLKSIETSVSTKELPIYSVETDEKKIAITFDSAWNDDDIDQLIQVLTNENCPSTFFVTGDWAERFPHSLTKLYNAGHEIASHSYNHTLYSTLTKDEIISDMDKCDSIIENIIGIRPNLCRAPSGDYTNNSFTNGLTHRSHMSFLEAIGTQKLFHYLPHDTHHWNGVHIGSSNPGN